jgi:hypothetical protein
MATVRRVPRLRSGRLCAHGAAGVLAEYDGNNNLLRKYIYGPGMKQIRNPKPETISKLVLSEAEGFKFPSVTNRQS